MAGMCGKKKKKRKSSRLKLLSKVSRRLIIKFLVLCVFTQSIWHSVLKYIIISWSSTWIMFCKSFSKQNKSKDKYKRTSQKEICMSLQRYCVTFSDMLYHVMPRQLIFCWKRENNEEEAMKHETYMATWTNVFNPDSPWATHFQ